MNIPPTAQSSCCVRDVMKHLYKSFVLYLSNTVLSAHLFRARYGGFVIMNASLKSGGNRSVSRSIIPSFLGSISYAIISGLGNAAWVSNQFNKSPFPANGYIIELMDEFGTINPSRIYVHLSV